MLLCDVNVLVYAHRQDAPDHEAFRTWLEKVVNGEATFGMSELVLSSFLRIVTHPRIFSPPTEMPRALEAVEHLLQQPNCAIVAPGPRHWDIFVRLCRSLGTKGNLVSDAYLAALAIESGSEWITSDRDYSRFLGLRWRHPLETE